MKVEIIRPVCLGFRGYLPGECPDVPEIVAEAWLTAGKAKAVGVAAAPMAAESPAFPAALGAAVTAETVETLCGKYTVPELRQMYEAKTGKKVHHKLNEKSLAEAILAAGK